MHLSFNTLSFEQFSIEQYIEFCKRFGYEYIELRLGAGLWTDTLSDTELSAARSKLDQAGIKIICIGSSLNIRGDYPENTAEFERALRIAAALGAKGVRIMVGTYRHYSTEPLLPMDYDGTVNWIARMCDRSLEYGINVCVELHSDYCTGKKVGKLLDNVARPNAKALWDIMNPLCSGEAIEETYRYLKGRISHLHMKNGIHDPNPAALEFIYTAMENGTLPLFEIFKLMEQEEQGEIIYSFEWVERFKPELQVLKLSEEKVLESYVNCMRAYKKRFESHEGGSI